MTRATVTASFNLSSLIFNLCEFKSMTKPHTNRIPGLTTQLLCIMAAVRHTYEAAKHKKKAQVSLSQPLEGGGPASSEVETGGGASGPSSTTSMRRTAKRKSTCTQRLSAATPPTTSRARRRNKKKKTKKELVKSATEMMCEARSRSKKGSKPYVNFWHEMAAEVVKLASDSAVSQPLLRKRIRLAKEALDYTGETASSEDESTDEDTSSESDDLDTELLATDGCSMSATSGSAQAGSKRKRSNNNNVKYCSQKTLENEFEMYKDKHQLRPNCDKHSSCSLSADWYI